MSDFHVTMTLLLSIAILIAMMLEEAWTTGTCYGRDCHSDADCLKDGCPEWLHCYPQPLLFGDGFCD